MFLFECIDNSEKQCFLMIGNLIADIIIYDSPTLVRATVGCHSSGFLLARLSLKWQAATDEAF